MPDRVVLFVDWQNVISGARALFHQGGQPRATDGQINPVKLGELICRRARPGTERRLHEVRVYCGLADRRQAPKMFLSRSNQCRAWEQAGASVFTRPLQYLPAPQGSRKSAREKGIDVAIAVDFVAMAIRGQFDVGVLFSADTDLRPPLEFVAAEYPQLRAEVAAWKSGRNARRLNFDAPYPTWCHYLDDADYEAVRDLTDYRPRR